MMRSRPARTWCALVVAAMAVLLLERGGNAGLRMYAHGVTRWSRRIVDLAVGPTRSSWPRRGDHAARHGRASRLRPDADPRAEPGGNVRLRPQRRPGSRAWSPRSLRGGRALRRGGAGRRDHA